jgi:hypothetical protein
VEFKSVYPQEGSEARRGTRVISTNILCCDSYSSAVLET